jgi:uncharacterized Zn finger protein
MDKDKRDLIDRIGADLAGIMEDASVDAALLRGVERDKLSVVVDRLAAAADRSQSLAKAMQALISN